MDKKKLEQEIKLHKANDETEYLTDKLAEIDLVSSKETLDEVVLKYDGAKFI